MRFTKMQGAGNDYVYVNGLAEHVEHPADLARRISDRHFGVGADGLILILPSDAADVRMRIFNADGSEAEMCGNGIRCVAKYAWDHGLCRHNPMSVETGAGVLRLDLHVDRGAVGRVTVNMGRPALDLPSIGVEPHELRPGRRQHEYHLSLPQGSVDAVLVSMGNPHAVIFTDDLAGAEVTALGPLIEHHRAFPRRINVHWAQVQSHGELIMRTWERGSGVTLACGTGACAVAVAAAMTQRTQRKILAHLPGGDLDLEWLHSDDCVYMSGPAVEVFTGDYPV